MDPDRTIIDTDMPHSFLRNRKESVEFVTQFPKIRVLQES
jgi:hypothetical protein